MNYLLYCILIILPIYTDSPLGLVFGASGYSLLTSLSLVVMVGYILIRRKLVLTKIAKAFFIQTVFIFIGSIVGILSWAVISDSIVEHGENLIFKSFKIILHYLSYPCYFYLLSRCMRKFTFKKIARPFIYIFVFLSCFCVLEYNSIPYAFEWLHFNSMFPYWRIRLLTMESSNATTIIIVYFALSCFYYIHENNFFGLSIPLVCAFILVETTSSKGLLICILLFIVYCIFNIMKNKGKSKYFFLVVILTCFTLASVNVIPKLQLMIKTDLEKYTSISSRIYTFTIAFLTGLIMPFGSGGAYLGFFPLLMNKLLSYYSSLPFQFNITEIQTVLERDTDFAVATSSGLMQFHMYWGVIGSFLFYRILFKIMKGLKRTERKGVAILLSALSVLIIGITFSLPFSYDFVMFLAFCNYLSIESQSIGGHTNENWN